MIVKHGIMNRANNNWRGRMLDINDLERICPDEESCRILFEKFFWKEGRRCPNCNHQKSWSLNSKKIRCGVYECSKCGHHFTVTSNTYMRSTKLSLRKWLKAWFVIGTLEKIPTTIFLSNCVGVSQKTAWKIRKTILRMEEDGICMYAYINEVLNRMNHNLEYSIHEALDQ